MKQIKRKRKVYEMKYLRRKQMLEKTGLKLTTQWRLEKVGQFPARRMISKGLCGWLESEVDEWIKNRPGAIVKEHITPEQQAKMQEARKNGKLCQQAEAPHSREL